MDDLTEKKCVPCEAGTPPIQGDAIKPYAEKLSKGWYVAEGTKIRRKFKLKDFRDNMDFVNKIADLAEEEGHHPDLCISWNILEVTLWTHAIAGLSENDFILAAKIDKLAHSRKSEMVPVPEKKGKKKVK